MAIAKKKLCKRANKLNKSLKRQFVFANRKNVV